MLDADLQHPPELLGEMLAVMDREKSDVVYGRRKKKLMLKICSNDIVPAFFTAPSNICQILNSSRCR